MTERELIYIKTIADEGSISKAAQKLFISQQSLSNHISRLESELNVRLFNRTPRLSLTYTGICLLRTSKQILELEKQIYAQIDDIANERTSRLSIGLTRVRARTILPLILPSYSKLYPDVEVHTTITDNHGLQTKLLSGELDLVICNNPPVVENITHIPLFQDKFCIVVPKDIMLSKYGDSYADSVLAHQRGQEFDSDFFCGLPILMSVGTHVRSAIDRFFQMVGIVPNILMETDDIETLFSLCERGMGIMFSYEKYAQKFLSSLQSSADNSGVLVFPINNESLYGNIKICYLNDRYLNKAARQFVEIAQEKIKFGA